MSAGVSATDASGATGVTATDNDRRSGELAMLLLNESLALERMRSRRDREHEAELLRHRDAARRLAAARRLQRRAESASRRARALLASV